MTVTIFENLTESMKLGKSYKVHNLLLTFFQNTRKLKSANSTEVKCVEDIEINMKLPKDVTQLPEDILHKK